MGISVFAVLTILLPELAREEAVGKIQPPSAYPYLLVWILSIPIFLALYQTLKLLNLIDKKKAFSDESVGVLQKIKYSAISFAILVVVFAAAVVIPAKNIDPAEDVTPVGTFGFIFVFVSSVIAIFVAVLQKLLKNAIEIKSENDLTV